MADFEPIDWAEIGLPDEPEGGYPDPVTLARACVGLRHAPPGGEACARSRLGGHPLVPRGTAWPIAEKGPLQFLAQIDFGELSRSHRGRCRGLPSSGILALFYDTKSPRSGDAPSDRSAWALVFAPEPDDAIELAPPEAAAPVPATPLVLDVAEMLPSLEDAWCDPTPLYTKIGLRDWESPWPTPKHWVGGHADWVTGDARFFANLAANGIESNLGSVRRAQARGQDVKRIAGSSREWRLLWQLDATDPALGLLGVGHLFVLIRDEDLAALRFDRAWVSRQVS